MGFRVQGNHHDEYLPKVLPQRILQEALVSKVPLVVLDDEEDLEVDPRQYPSYKYTIRQ